MIASKSMQGWSNFLFARQFASQTWILILMIREASNTKTPGELLNTVVDKVLGLLALFPGPELRMYRNCLCDSPPWCISGRSYCGHTLNKLASAVGNRWWVVLISQPYEWMVMVARLGWNLEHVSKNHNGYGCWWRRNLEHVDTKIDTTHVRIIQSNWY